MYKFCLLALIVVFSIACGGGGGDQMLRGYTPTTTEVYANVQPSIEGISQYNVVNQRTTIRSVDDFDFYHRLVTGNANPLAEAIINTKDVLMVIYTTEKFNVDSMTITTSTNALNIYYYNTASNSTTKYQFYYLDKSIFDPSFIEIVK